MIRDARESDFGQILALNAESVHFLSPLDDARLRHLHKQAAYHRVVDDDGTIGAFLLAFREGVDYDSPNYAWFAGTYPQFLYIDRIVVSMIARGRGLGAQLYNDIIAFASESRLDKLTCEFDIDPPNPGVGEVPCVFRLPRSRPPARRRGQERGVVAGAAHLIDAAIAIRYDRGRRSRGENIHEPDRATHAPQDRREPAGGTRRAQGFPACPRRVAAHRDRTRRHHRRRHLRARRTAGSDERRAGGGAVVHPRRHRQRGGRIVLRGIRRTDSSHRQRLHLWLCRARRRRGVVHRLGPAARIRIDRRRGRERMVGLRAQSARCVRYPHSRSVARCAGFRTGPLLQSGRRHRRDGCRRAADHAHRMGRAREHVHRRDQNCRRRHRHRRRHFLCESGELASVHSGTHGRCERHRSFRHAGHRDGRGCRVLRRVRLRHADHRGGGSEGSAARSAACDPVVARRVDGAVHRDHAGHHRHGLVHTISATMRPSRTPSSRSA